MFLRCPRRTGVWLSALLVAPGAAAAQDPPKPPPPTADQFELRAEPVVALRGGPILVRVDFRYTGPGAVFVTTELRGPNAVLVAPPGWADRPAGWGQTANAINGLINCRDPVHWDVLRALADNPGAAWPVREARKVLGRVPDRMDAKP